MEGKDIKVSGWSLYRKAENSTNTSSRSNPNGLNCASCLNNLGAEGYVSALGQNWHKDCFRCSVCDMLLSHWYFEKSGLLFCQDDYWARFGESCQHCAQVITGPVMSAGAHRFHPECFACVACGAHIEDGEPYALVERSKLYCGGCYKAGSGGTVSGHSIRALCVPRHALTRTEDVPQGHGVRVSETSRSHGVRDKLSVLARGLLRAVLSICIQLTCHRIDSTCGLLTLHIGDRILEINGTPVRNRPINEIEKVLSCSDTVLQLTIEHDPGPIDNQKQMCNETGEILQKHVSNIQQDTGQQSKDLLKTEMDIPIVEVEGDVQEVIDEVEWKKERLFKRKGEGQVRVRMMKRKQSPTSPLLGNKERSSSMSKLLDVVDSVNSENSGVLCDLSRARSFRAHHDTGQKVFRACDLLQGELLGSGFFGQVYKVTHRDTNEVMVLKQLYRVDEEAHRNFLKEVAVLRSLSHPNVLRFIGVLYKDKRLHLITEYVAGGTLQQLLHDTSVQLSWLERAGLARDIAAGVGYLHRMNVIHRDLNSHNCLVRQDKTVIVADFGLARIVQRTASSAPPRHHHATLRRKRYTVVGNPYWMAPEMMNGNLYDEKVDVFSFGIILCEIIGRVQADPDFLPRRGDFGLNEAQFLDKFCTGCPEPFYRLAFLACHLDPDHRPPFEVSEIWLESLVMHLSTRGPLPGNLLLDILQYSHGHTARGHATPERCVHEHSDIFCAESLECCRCWATSDRGLLDLEGGVVKSKSNATMPQQEVSLEESPRGRALGKCVSASHICQQQRPIVTVTNLSRSQNALVNTPSGYILRAHGKNINITKVDDITQWLDPPPPLKRTSPDTQLNNSIQEHTSKAMKVEENSNLPSFLRNQSVEGLESQSKHDMDTPLPFCRHFSIPDNCEDHDNNESDSSDDDLSDMCNWYKNVSSFKKLEKMDVDPPKNLLASIVKKGENLLPKKSSYDLKDVTVRNPECLRGTERKIPEVDYRRYNIDHINKSPFVAAGLKNLPKPSEVQKNDKTNFFTKKLLSPKLSRLFKPNSVEVQRNKELDEDKSRSKFFVQRPSSPSNVCRSYRVRPMEENDRRNLNPPKLKNKVQNGLLKSDIKLASMGKPMTPIFRRHIQAEHNDFTDGRFSYRDKRSNRCDLKIQEPKFIELGRNRIKTPVKNELISPSLIRSNQSNNIPALVKDKRVHSVFDSINKVDDKVTKKREPGISRSNYVSLANLKINSKGKNLEKTVKGKNEDTLNDTVPIERVI